jgi:hypothetical protein
VIPAPRPSPELALVDASWPAPASLALAGADPWIEALVSPRSEPAQDR